MIRSAPSCLAARIAKSDCAVADDGDRFARSGFRSYGGEPTGAEYVGGCKEAAGLPLGRLSVDRDEGAVRERDASVFGLGADRAHHDLVDTARLKARLADFAGVVRRDERAHDEVPNFDVVDLRADLFDDAHVFVSHRRRAIQLFDAAVRPEVGTADAGGCNANDRVGRFDDHRRFDLFDPDVAGGMHDDSAHDVAPHHRFSRVTST